MQSVGVLAVLAFAWTKLGLGEAIKEVGAVIQPDQVAGVVRPVNGRCPAGWVKMETGALSYEPGITFLLSFF